MLLPRWRDMTSFSRRVAGPFSFSGQRWLSLCGMLSVLLPLTARANVTSTGSFYGSPTYTDTWAGLSGSGTLQVTAGSSYATNTLNIGSNAGATGTITLSGTGTTLTTNQNVFVGVSGAGVLNIQSGAVMTSNGPAFPYGIEIGYYSGSSANVTVDGDGSRWVVPTMNALVGVFAGSSGTVTIQNGGNITFGAGQINVSGGTLLVTGTDPITHAASTLNMLSSPQFHIGSTSAVPATATISAGGIINSAGDNSVGPFQNQSGSMIVTGSGSQWNIAGTLSVGQSSGTGTLTIADGAVLNVSATGTANAAGTGFQSIAGDGVITIAGTPSSTNPGTPASQGTLNIGAYDLSAATTAGAIHAATIAFGPGVGVLNFNQTDTFTLSTAITGGGSLVQRGAGTTIITGPAAHTGTTSVQAGKLLVNGSIATSPVTVASGATLGGSGSIGGLTTLESGAHLALGVSPATLLFTHGLTLDDGAVLDLQVGTASDLLEVSGGTLTGSLGAGGITLNLSDSGGFAATTYTLIDFSGATLADFSASDFTLGNTIPGYHYDLALVGNTLQVTATSADIPEPASSVLFLTAGGLALGRCRWRQSRR